jgi:hypothetical protein
MLSICWEFLWPSETLSTAGLLLAATVALPALEHLLQKRVQRFSDNKQKPCVAADAHQPSLESHHACVITLATMCCTYIPTVHCAAKLPPLAANTFTCVATYLLDCQPAHVGTLKEVSEQRVGQQLGVEKGNGGLDGGFAAQLLIQAPAAEICEQGLV